MKESIKKFLICEFILFVIGGIIYALMEIIGRGFTHWSMFIVGGLCFVIIGLLNEWYTWKTPFLLQMGIGCFVITAMELISGYIVNIKLGWNVWDYSDRCFNLYGQICLRNSIYWFFLSGVAIVLDDFIRWKFFDEDKPRYTLFYHALR
jgi:uncharacterized membrane protein